MPALSSKVAIITGASSGIGHATAKLFARQGASLVLAARRQAALDALVEDINQAGGRAVALAGDVGDEHFAKALVELATQHFGGLDVAFNNAGSIGDMKATPEVSLAEWEAVISTNLTGAFLGARYQLPAMLERKGGSLTIVGHTIGLQQMAAYAASKAGLIGLTQALAAEFGPSGIRVNALLPGGTDTPMGRSVASTPEALAYVEGLHALKRMATAEEIAQSALFLASDASSFTTGSAMLADGGISIYRT